MSFDSSKITRKNSITTYSPTTGTCQMSPFASPASSKEQDHKSEPSNGKRKKMNHLSLNERKESTTKDDEFMVLLSQVEKSSEEILEIMQNLSSIQALEGSRELGKLIGISRMSCFFLQKEMQKTKELMTKVTKQKLFEKKNSGPPNKVPYGFSNTFRRNALTMDTNFFCICLIIFKGTEEMFVINLPSKYQIIALGRFIQKLELPHRFKSTSCVKPMYAIPKNKK
ncbi:centromere protein R [Prionailurus iriomotensis]